MTKFFIKLAFIEKRLFVKTYDCGYYTTLREEPKILTQCHHEPHQPVNQISTQVDKSYDVYVAVDHLTQKEIDQALSRLKHHYPDGYVAISASNDFPNAIYQNLVAALKNLLEKKWGLIAINHFGLFNKNCQLPRDVQNQVLSHFEPNWNNAHLETMPNHTSLEDNLKLIDAMASFSQKNFRR